MKKVLEINASNFEAKLSNTLRYGKYWWRFPVHHLGFIFSWKILNWFEGSCEINFESTTYFVVPWNVLKYRTTRLISRCIRFFIWKNIVMVFDRNIQIVENWGYFVTSSYFIEIRLNWIKQWQVVLNWPGSSIKRMDLDSNLSCA